MKIPFLSLSAVLLITLPTLAQEAETPEVMPLSAAILDFKDGSPDLEGTGASVSAVLQAILSGTSDAIFVERAELAEVLGEQELTLSESVTPGQAARVGQLTGAEALLSGRVFPAQDRIYIVAKVISTSTGRVFGATGNYQDGGDLDAAVNGLAEKITTILSEKNPEIRGGKPLEELVLEGIKKSMEGKVAPKVYVSVEEQIIRTQVIDPAVETEIQRTLQGAGWTVVENAADADIVVTGEAIAETGARRGNLWFTRSRLEFKVIDAANQVLKIDRITTGFVDLAESVAAKGALQKAGLIASGLVADAWLAQQN